MRRFFLILSAILLFVLLAPPGAADVVVMKDGREFEGVVVDQNDMRVIVRVAGGDIPLPAEGVAEIQRDTPRKNAALALANTARGRSPLATLRAVVEAKEAEVEPEALNDALVDNAHTIIPELGVLSRESMGESARLLREIAAWDRIIGPETRVVLARAFDEVRDREAAARQIEAAGLEVFQADPEAADWARDFLKDYVRRLVHEGKQFEAVEQIERLKLIDGDSASAQLPIVHLAASARARAAEDYEEALRIIIDQLWPHSPAIARNRARVTLNELVRWASARERENQARGWIASTAVTRMPVESLDANFDLYESEVQRLLNQDQPERALRILSSVDPMPRRLRQLALEAEFRVRRMETPETDGLALYELGQWAAENRLDEEALKVFEDLRANPLLKEPAERQMEQVRQTRDLEALNKALDFYDRGLMEDVLKVTSNLRLDEPGLSPNQKEIIELSELARKELETIDRQKPYLAEAAYQQAERAFFLGNLDESWSLVDMILTRFPETPAAGRASILLPDLMRQFEIQLIEGERRTIPDFAQRFSPEEFERSDALDQEIRRLMEEM